MNLPADDKMVEPHFTMLWDHDIPRHVVTGADGQDGGDHRDRRRACRTRAAAAAAALVGGAADADVAIWHAQFDPGGRWTMPPARDSDTVRTLYVFDGSGLVASTVTRSRDRRARS